MKKLTKTVAVAFLATSAILTVNADDMNQSGDISSFIERPKSPSRLVRQNSQEDGLTAVSAVHSFKSIPMEKETAPASQKTWYASAIDSTTTAFSNTVEAAKTAVSSALSKAWTSLKRIASF